MDDSQSSDFFPNSTDLSYDTATDMCTIMSYDMLLSNTKSALSSDIEREIKKPTFSNYFTTLLEDCCACVSQSLDIIINMLCESNIEINKLTAYMTDAVSILQMLSDYIKAVVEVTSMNCSNMRAFPTTTGQIIMMVYTHCKDSESLYGTILSSVETQLRDMFRSCHDLQLTYLTIIEKHFIFDSSAKQDLLIESLAINLKIGEIVQTLDVKTMAEQWKAYTLICQKYADSLTDKNIYCDCTKVLCKMIENSIRNAIAKNQEEKIILRSLKVSSFTIKILLRICSIFNKASIKNFEHVLGLLVYIYLNSCSYLDTECERNAQFINLYDTNITNPADCLLRDLFRDDMFVNCLMTYNMDILRRDDKLLGFIQIILSLIKFVVQRNEDQNVNALRNKLIDCIFNFLPYCHVWFNTGLRFSTGTKSNSTQGLYEQLLTYTTALAATMNSEEYRMLEKNMIEAILRPDCYGALFSSNLWVLLARSSGRQLLQIQLTSLCRIYQKLENNQLFHNSPQDAHLRHTINRLFEAMHNEDKVAVCKQFHISDDANVSLWICLEIRNLPLDVRSDAEEEITERLKLLFREFASDASDIDALIKTMKLAATCSFDNDNNIADCLMIAWEKACPKNNLVIRGDLDRGTLWYFHYVEALVALTYSMKDILHQQSAALVKILHVTSEGLKTGSTELKLLLMPILCELALCDVQDENKNTVETLFTQTFKQLFRERPNVIRNKLYDILRTYDCNKNLQKIISQLVNDDDSLGETWAYFNKNGDLRQNRERKELLSQSRDFYYHHKCIENGNITEISDSGSFEDLKKTCRSNFDFADIDTLFENESDSEQPVCKKAKLNNEADVIIATLENDASLVCKVKENIFTSEHKNRIRNVCIKLQNIIE